jgi:hypothetical protein
MRQWQIDESLKMSVKKHSKQTKEALRLGSDHTEKRLSGERREPSYFFAG